MMMRDHVIAVLLLFCNAPPLVAENVSDTQVPSHDLRAGGDENRRYFLIGPAGGAKAPKDGFGLVLILPGGDGSAEFHPFCTNIFRNALPPGYLAAQLVAVQWTPAQKIVWPTARSRVAGQKFTTEAFIASVVEDVKKKHAVDPKRVFTLTWSSSGPAAYTASVADKTPITGSFVAMSVFNPQFLGNVGRAKGKSYYLYHSPEDKVCPFRMAETARGVLTKQGANVEFVRYPGGHGWTSPTLFTDIRKGLVWLQKRAASQPASLPAGS